MLKEVGKSKWPCEDDIVGKIAVALAQHDVREPPKAMLKEELEALEKVFEYCWLKGNEQIKETVYKLREWLAVERGAHNQTFKTGSYPIHYGREYWREYYKEASIAYKIASENTSNILGSLQDIKDMVAKLSDKPIRI